MKESLFFYMLNRINYFVHKLISDTGDGSFCFGEGTLQGTQGNSGFLGCHTREELQMEKTFSIAIQSQDRRHAQMLSQEE